MEEPIPEPSNITIPVSKKTLALAIILIVAALALVLILSALFSQEDQPDPTQPTPFVADTNPVYKPSGTESKDYRFYSGWTRVEDGFVGADFKFSNQNGLVAVNGSLGIRIESGEHEFFSGYFNLSEKDFNFKEYTSTRTSTEKGYQEIIEETTTDIFYELRIPLSALNKGVSQNGTIYAEFVFPNGESISWEGSLTDIPLDPTKFSGNPDSVSRPTIIVSIGTRPISPTSVIYSNIEDTIYYKGFFSLNEKNVPVSSQGVLELSAENKDGKTILSKTITVTPNDFSFEAIKTSIYSQTPNKQLKYVFEFSSDELPEGECVSKILVSFTAPNSQPMQSDNSSRSNCLVNCSLKGLCPK